MILVLQVSVPSVRGLTLKGRVAYTEGDKAIFAFRYNSTSHRVVKVYEGGPAARAGLEAGDKIIAIDGQALKWPTLVRSGDSFLFLIEKRDRDPETGLKVLTELEITAQDPRDIKNPEIHKIWIKN